MIPYLLVALAIVLATLILILFTLATNRFRDDARLFDLRREMRDEEQIRIRLAGRVGDLEDRVARLEDPHGKKKRGHDIYTPDPRQVIVGLRALQEAMQEHGYPVSDADVAETFHELLGDDGELMEGKDNGKF